MSTATLNKTAKLRLGGGKSNAYRGGRKRPSGNGSPTGWIVVRRILIIWLTLAVLAALSVGLLYGYRLATTHPFFGLTSITVEGNQRLTRGHILKTGDVSLGLNSLDMNVAEVEEKLFRDPWIKAATVRRELPNRLWIGVTEKVPAFWVRQGNGLYYADAEGRVIAPVHPGDTESLPMLAVAREDETVGSLLSSFLGKIGNGEIPISQEQIAWMRVNQGGEFEIFLDGRNLTLRMDADMWEIQLHRIKTVWRDLMERGEFAGAASITAAGDKVWVIRHG